MIPKRNRNGTNSLVANLTLKNVPDRLYQRLKATAAQNRRSINAEAIRCFEAVLESRRLNADDFLARAREHRRRNPDIFVTDLEIREAKREGRL